MPIKFFCPFGHRLVVPDDRAGKKGRCPTCNQRVYVPVANPPPSSAAKPNETEIATDDEPPEYESPMSLDEILAEELGIEFDSPEQPTQQLPAPKATAPQRTATPPSPPPRSPSASQPTNPARRGDSPAVTDPAGRYKTRSLTSPMRPVADPLPPQAALPPAPPSMTPSPYAAPPSMSQPPAMPPEPPRAGHSPPPPMSPPAAVPPTLTQPTSMPPAGNAPPAPMKVYPLNRPVTPTAAPQPPMAELAPTPPVAPMPAMTAPPMATPWQSTPPPTPMAMTARSAEMSRPHEMSPMGQPYAMATPRQDAMGYEGPPGLLVEPIDQDLLWLERVRVGWNVTAHGFTLAILVGMGFGLIPVFKFWGPDPLPQWALAILGITVVELVVAVWMATVQDWGMQAIAAVVTGILAAIYASGVAIIITNQSATSELPLDLIGVRNTAGGWCAGTAVYWGMISYGLYRTGRTWQRTVRRFLNARYAAAS